jgi:hypothetical protein
MITVITLVHRCNEMKSVFERKYQHFLFIKNLKQQI